MGLGGGFLVAGLGFLVYLVWAFSWRKIVEWFKCNSIYFLVCWDFFY